MHPLALFCIKIVNMPMLHSRNHVRSLKVNPESHSHGVWVTHMGLNPRNANIQAPGLSPCEVSGFQFLHPSGAICDENLSHSGMPLVFLFMSKFFSGDFSWRFICLRNTKGKTWNGFGL